MEPRKHEADFVKWCSDSGIEQLAKSGLLGGFIADSTEIRYEAYSAGAEKKEEEFNALLAKAREEGRKEAIPDRLIKELKQIRKSLIVWRERCFPNTNQGAVVDSNYPEIAMLASAPEVNP